MQLKFVKIILVIFLYKLWFFRFESYQTFILKINLLFYLDFCQKQQINVLNWFDWRWSICPLFNFEILRSKMRIYSFNSLLFLDLTICFSHFVNRMFFVVAFYFEFQFWTAFYCSFNFMFEFKVIHFVFYRLHVKRYKDI